MRDPAPGAAAAVQASEANGAILALVHCYCDPVAFELRIPVERTFLDITRDDGLAIRRKFSARVNPRFVDQRSISTATTLRIPDLLRPDDPETDVAKSSQDHISRWIEFFMKALEIAGAKVVITLNRGQTNQQYVHAVHVCRSEDPRRTKHIAFMFKVVQCELLKISDINAWANSRANSAGIPLDPEAQGMVNIFLRQTHKSRPGDGIILATSIVVFTPSKRDQTRSLCYPVPGIVNTSDLNADVMKWWSEMPDPLTWLTREVDQGIYLSPTFLPSRSNKSFNAWGFPRSDWLPALE